MSTGNTQISEEVAPSSAEQPSPTPAPASDSKPTETTPLVRRSRVSVAAVLAGDLPEPPQKLDAEQGGGQATEDSDAEDEAFVHIPAADAEGATHAVVAGEEGSRRRQSSIFRADVEAQLRKADPGMLAWLTSPNGMAFQIGLCVSLVAISAYETVVKARAIKNLDTFTVINNFDGSAKEVTRFMSASMTTNASIISVFLALGFAAYRKELPLIFDKTVFWPRMMRYIIPGCGFQLTAYLQVLALGFIAADVFKVLEQTRLLMTALMSMQFFGKKQSIAGWNALVVITLAAISYSETAGLVKQEACYAGIPGMGINPAVTLANVTAAAATCEAKGGSKAATLGLALTAIFVILQVGCCIVCEAVLKQEKKTPFYVQKFFLEVPGSALGLIITNVLNPIMYKVLLSPPFSFDADSKSMKSMKGKDGGFFEHIVDPFAGWNLMIWMAFMLFMAKSWCSGFLTKQLSAIVKQLCSVFGVGIIYFLQKIHPAEKAPFFYPEGLGDIKQSMVVADLCVLCAVVSYTLAGRDKKKKEQFKREVMEARQELKQA